jgi:hypothetical protein
MAPIGSSAFKASAAIITLFGLTLATIAAAEPQFESTASMSAKLSFATSATAAPLGVSLSGAGI